MLPELLAQPAGAVGRHTIDAGANEPRRDKRRVNRPHVAFQFCGLDFLNELGVQYLKLRQVDKAVEVLKESVKLNGDSFGSRLNLGIALLEAKKFGEAEEQLREALKRNTGAATAHMYLGIALLRLSKFEEAEKELLVATEANAVQLSMANYYLGGLYWRRHDYARAVEQLEKYLQLTPNAPDAERVRGTIKDLRARMEKSN